MTRWSMRTQFPHVQELQSPAKTSLRLLIVCRMVKPNDEAVVAHPIPPCPRTPQSPATQDITATFGCVSNEEA